MLCENLNKKSVCIIFICNYYYYFTNIIYISVNNCVCLHNKFETAKAEVNGKLYNIEWCSVLTIKLLCEKSKSTKP